MKKYPDENVLVVPRDKLFGGAPLPQGFGGDDLDALMRRIETEARFLPRDDVEDDPSQKQIIPYMLVRRGGAVLTLKRRSRQSETRLHDKLSIGVGGHINREDALEDPLGSSGHPSGGKPGGETAPAERGDASGVLDRGLRRELHEELDVRGELRVRPVGWLNDDSNPVGSVHFGLVFEVDASGAEVEIREKEHMSGEFRTPEELAELYGAMETWSQIVYDNLLKQPPAAGSGPSAQEES